MTGHRVVVIALLLGSLTPARAAEEVPTVDVISAEGPAVAFGSAAVVELPLNDRNVFALMGGLTPGGAFNDGVDAFDFSSSSWTEVEVSGGYQPTAFGAAAAVGPDVFLLGGQNAGGFLGFDNIGKLKLTFNELAGSIVAQYSEVTTTGDTPSPRDLLQAVYDPVTGLIYVLGGRDANLTLSKELFAFDPSTGRFERLADMPRPLAEFAAAVLGGGLVAVGGVTYAEPGDQVVVNDRVLVYDRAENTWEERIPVGDVATPTYFNGGGPVARDKLWFFGGFDGNGAPTNQSGIYNSATNRSTRGPDLPSPLAGMVVGVVPSSATSGDHVEVLIHGGDLGGTVSNVTLRGISTERVAPDYGVAAMVDFPGFNTHFDGQAWVFNGGPIGARVAGRFRSRQGTDPVDLTSSFTVGPGVMTYFSNTLTDIWGIGNQVGAAGFRVTEGDVSDLIGQSTITGEDNLGRRYGQSFGFTSTAAQRLRYEFRAGDGETATSSHGSAAEHRRDHEAGAAALLRETPGSGETTYLFTTEDPVSNRVNVGGMAVGETAVVLTPELPLGNPLAQGMRVELEDGESFQVNNVYDTFGLGPGDANAVISLAVEAGILIPYGSVLDGNGAYTGTNDPTTIRQVAGPGAKTVYLLELGSISGQGGSRYNGSASILNFGQQAATVQVDFFRRGSSGVAASATLSVPGGGVLGFSDFAREVLGVVGDVGTLRFTTDGDGIAVTGREYSVETDSGGTVTGTAGQLMRGLTEDDMLEPGLVCHGLGLREGGGDRSHLAFFNPGTSTVTVEVSLYNGADGALEGTSSFTVPGEQLVQFNNLIPVLNPGHDDSEKRIAVTVSGPLLGHVFRVNPWNDPVTFDLHCR